MADKAPNSPRRRSKPNAPTRSGTQTATSPIPTQPTDGKPNYRLSDPASVRMMLERQNQGGFHSHGGNLSAAPGGHPFQGPTVALLAGGNLPGGNIVGHSHHSQQQQQQQQHHHHQQQQQQQQQHAVASYLDQHPGMVDAEGRTKREGPYPSERLFIPPTVVQVVQVMEFKSEFFEIGVSCSLEDKTPRWVMAVMFIKKKGGRMWDWKEIGRTETLYGINFQFSRALMFEHEYNREQPIKICVYPTNDEGRYVRNIEPIGEALFSESEFVRVDEQQIVRGIRTSQDGYQSGAGNNVGTLTLNLINMKSYVKMEVDSRDIKGSHVMGTAEPYIIIYRFQSDFYSNPKNAGRSEEEAFEPVYRSEVIKGTNTTAWKPFQVTIKRLCDGDFGEILLFRCFDLERGGNSQLIGEFKTTLYEICLAKGLIQPEGSPQDNEENGRKIAEFPLVTPQVLLKKDQSSTGAILVTELDVVGQEIIINRDIQRISDDKLNEARSAIFARSKYSGRSRAKSRASAPSLKKPGKPGAGADGQSQGKAGGAVSWSRGLSGLTDDEEDDDEEGSEDEVLSDVDEDSMECINLMIESLEKPSDDDHFKVILEVHGLVYHHEKLRRAFTDHGGLDCLINLLDSEPLIQEKAAFVFKNIAVSSFVRERIRSTGAIIRIIPHLQNSQPFVQRQLAWMITHIASDNNHVRDLLRELGVIQILRDLINTSDESLLEQYLLTLASTCHHNEFNQTLAVELNFLGPLVTLLSTKSEKLKLVALNAISNLTSDSNAGRETLREMGGFMKIVHILDDENDDYRYGALCVITSAVIENTTNQDLLRESGWLKKIGLMLSHPHEQIQEIAAICIINSVANNEKNKICIREYNAIMPLLSLAKGKLPSLPYLATAATKNLSSIRYSPGCSQQKMGLSSDNSIFPFIHQLCQGNNTLFTHRHTAKHNCSPYQATIVLSSSVLSVYCISPRPAK